MKKDVSEQKLKILTAKQIADDVYWEEEANDFCVEEYKRVLGELYVGVESLKEAIQHPKHEERPLPDWTSDEAEWNKMRQENPETFTNCAKCGKKLILMLCKHGEKENFCFNCCPEHKWQSDYDWQIECARCGISKLEYYGNIVNGLLAVLEKAEAKP